MHQPTEARERIMVKIIGRGETVAELPVGTRVIKSKADDALVGTVVGHVQSSVVVRWDNGGSSSAPAHFGLWIVEVAA